MTEANGREIAVLFSYVPSSGPREREAVIQSVGHTDSDADDALSTARGRDDATAYDRNAPKK